MRPDTTSPPHSPLRHYKLHRPNLPSGRTPCTGTPPSPREDRRQIPAMIYPPCAPPYQRKPRVRGEERDGSHDNNDDEISLTQEWVPHRGPRLREEGEDMGWDERQRHTPLLRTKYRHDLPSLTLTITLTRLTDVIPSQPTLTLPRPLASIPATRHDATRHKL